MLENYSFICISETLPEWQYRPVVLSFEHFLILTVMGQTLLSYALGPVQRFGSVIQLHQTKQKVSMEYNYIRAESFI